MKKRVSKKERVRKDYVCQVHGKIPPNEVYLYIYKNTHHRACKKCRGIDAKRRNRMAAGYDKDVSDIELKVIRLIRRITNGINRAWRK